jgi:predicted ferric reductase
MKPLGLLVIVVTTLFPTYQLFLLPNISDQLALFSQYLGLAALILMAWGQIMATRMRGVEAIFGGLDQVYVLHKWAGIIALACILLHDTIDADMGGIGRETALSDLAETLGEISLYGLLVLVVISVATFIPYHLWKWTHKAMGILFIAGAFHFFFILKPFDMIDPAGVYTGIFCALGIGAYVWTSLPERMRPSHAYKISDLVSSRGALSVTLEPEKKGISARPGQFGFFQFSGSGNDEVHPFTFSKIGADGQIRVSIKSLGDYTSGLTKRLKIGQKAQVRGPFGRFRPGGAKPEVWIAGGIGITPFLACAHAMQGDAKTVHLFYCVRSREMAPNIAELEDLAQKNANLNLHVMASSEGSRLSASHISDTVGIELHQQKIFYCGSKSLRQNLAADLKKFGVSASKFHYEEFEFRTGVGLKRLASWIYEQAGNKARQRKLVAGE